MLRGSVIVGCLLVLGCGVGPLDGPLEENAAVLAIRQGLSAATQVGARQVPSAAFANVAPQQVFHVAVSGNDANPGTQAQPWRTIGKAVRTLGPGQAAYVHGGTYQERLSIQSASRDGTASAPIRLQAAPGETVYLRGGDGKGGPMLRWSRAYWVVSGFRIDAAGSSALGVHFENARNAVLENCDVTGGVAPNAVVLSASTDIVIRNNTIHDYRFGPGQDSHGVLVLPGSQRVLIQGNHSWGNAGDSFQCQGPDTGGPGATPIDITVEKNRYHEDHENAIDIKSCSRVTVRNNKFFSYRASPTAPQGTVMVVHYSASDILIEGNRIWNSGRALSLGGVMVWNTPVTNVVIRRNLVFDQTTERNSAGDGFRIGTSRGVKLYNNTFANIPHFGIKVGDGDRGPSASTEVFNNIFFDTGRALDVWLPGTTGLVSEKNLLFNEVRPTVVRMTGELVPLSQWRSRTGQDQTSIVANPLFIDNPRYNDYFTRPGSPARDVAIPTGDWACGDGTDLGFLESCF